MDGPPAPPPLPPEREAADLVPQDARGVWRHPEAETVWRGVVWSRLGRGDHAWAWWDRVEAGELGPWVAAERGRVLRELGLHDHAEALESPALSDVTDVVDAVMLRISLAADAIGRGRTEVARMRIRAARDLLRVLVDGPRVARQRLRLTWVEVELALGSSHTPPLQSLPAWEDGVAGFPHDYAHGTRFHRAKGLMFAGIVRDDPRLLDAAAEMAPPALRWAVELARADRDLEGAVGAAGHAWSQIVAPPGYEGPVGATPTAARLAPPDQRPRSLGSSVRAPSGS